MIKYAVERMTERLVEEIKYLLDLHWEEIALYKDKIEFLPDYEAYYALDEAGALQIVTVRKDGAIIGYYISFVYTHPHYKENKFAQNDILFIHPEYRKGTIAYRMFKFAENELKKIGCSVLLVHMKDKFSFEPLCKKLGMDKQEIVYSKYIGD